MSNINRSNGVIPPARRLALMLGASLVFLPCALNAQEILFQEGFETEGEGTRYVTEGSDVYEVPRIRSEIGNQDQAGPIYWARKSKVSIVGVPGPTPARRAIMYWHHSIESSLVTPAFLALFESTVKWLANNKAGATVMFSPAPNGPGDEVLRDHLMAKGYKIIEDDGADLPKTPNFDVVIKSSNGNTGNPSRFAQYAAPMLTYNGPDHDDELVSTIGATQADLDLGDITIAAAGHAAAGGKTGSFKAVTGPSSFDSIGSDIPVGAVTLATFERASAADPNVKQKVPFIVLVESGANGGSVYGGGPFGGHEGNDFFAGSALNKFATDVAVKTLTFTKPINTAGKPKLKLTIALAATYLDFETGDYFKVFIDPDGDGPLEIDTNAPLIHFTAPSANDKYFNDVTTNAKKPTRLGLKFEDVTYDIPGNPSKIGIRIEALTTWWNEIVGFDNIRVTSGDPAPTSPSVGNLTGLLAYWRMDESSGDVVADSSGKGNNGKIVNNTAGSWVKDAVRGNVYKATGTNVINFGTIVPAMTLTSDFTWSLWVKSDMTGTASAPNNNIVFGNRYNASGADFSPREFIKFTPSNFEWHFNAAPQNINYTDFVTNVWAHHLVVKKGNTLTYYLDGKQSGTPTTITGTPKNPQPLYLGGQGTQERWRGLADEVAIFDRALSPAEAQQVYDLGKAGSALAPPPLKLGFERTNTGLKLTFEGTLQSADALTGPWADVAGAKSPAEIAFSGNAKFYRIKK
ncbi:MAG: LamG domain-containing protein [Verrucomicrobia bacterium]|nr:LamG domain-containing protein [Verrucomicrobiota bacterium]